ncbi:MAG: hypothetical protein ACYTFV_03750 [Planctomycetota bacterium]|jgi:hypothetical protein
MIDTLDALYLEIAPITQARSQREMECFMAMDAVVSSWDEGGDLHQAVEHLRDALHRHAIPCGPQLLSMPKPPPPEEGKQLSLEIKAPHVR